MASAPADAMVTDGDRVRITRPIGKKTLPELESGPATLRVSASRPVLRGLRQVSSEASRDIQVRLTPPRVAVVSTHHYVNQGGAEMIVYRVTPPDAESGVRVGDVTYPGFPASGARLSDPELKVAFFALLYNQAPDTPMEVFARDIAGNEARAQFEHRVFPKKFRNSTNSARRQVSLARRAGDSAVVSAAEGIGRLICCRRSSRSTTTCAG